jgi:hypothetical protein
LNFIWLKNYGEIFKGKSIEASQGSRFSSLKSQKAETDWILRGQIVVQAEPRLCGKGGI